ncbi:MAG TPA: nucleotidyltransferase domain-containing protein [Microcoleus sp.]|nr:nucleotidyltransferase domain-containing protein [Microcoleus sp.]
MSINNKLKNILTQLRSHFEQLYGDRLTQMVLYGSQARGDARPDSDIDILVVLKGQVNPGEEIKRTSQIRGDLSLQNDEVISCLFMDEQRFIHYNRPLLRNIRKEGMSFLNKPLTGGYPAHPTKKLTLCGTGILPVLENAKRGNCEHFHLL